VTYKLLTDKSHIIAIKETGNVYSYEAYKELNKDAKNYRDLLDDTKFDPI
jgi:peptidyl-prolyl cis-trans isomerase-like protein 2